MELEWVEISQCVALKRNPQYVTPHGMEALKSSIERDGFLAPVRPLAKSSKNAKERYEILSGNHRLMAARELGMDKVPALIGDFDEMTAKRIAVNLNTIHGDPSAELLAPFLAELEDEILATVHLDDDLLRAVKELDADLAKTLANLEIPDDWNNASSQGGVPKQCVCPNCGRSHAEQRDAEVAEA